MKHYIIYLFILFSIVANAQSLVSVSPNTGVAGSSVNITITGIGTAFTNTSPFVLSAGTSVIPVLNIVAVSATVVQGTVTIPANAVSGAYRLSALAGITPILLNNAFTVIGGGAAAEIVSVTPGQGYPGQFVELEIGAAHTLFESSENTTVSLIRTGSTPIIVSAFATSDTTLLGFLSIPADADLGTYSIVIATSNSGILTQTNAFAILPDPNGILSALEPNEGNKGDTVAVILEGIGTSFTQMISIGVQLFGTDMGGVLETRNVQVLTDSTLSFDIIVPVKARRGTYDIYVLFDTATGTNYLTLSAAFTVAGDASSDPRLVSITPSSAKQGQTLEIIFHGSNTTFTDSLGMDLVIFNMDTAFTPNLFTVLNDSTIKALFTIPVNLAAGIYDVGVFCNTDGYLELTESFTVMKTTGVNELYRNHNPLTVYPNPAKDYLTLEMGTPIVDLFIMDIQGKMIRVDTHELIRSKQGNYTVSLEEFHLQRGLHFIRLETDQGVQYQKFIVE